MLDVLEFWPSRSQQTVTMLDLDVHMLTGASGESFLQPNANGHLMCLIDSNVNVSFSADGEPLRDVRWPAGSMGFLPADMSLRAIIPKPHDHLLVRLNDNLFRLAAFETYDRDKAAFRYMPAMLDPVSAHLIIALKHLAESGRPQDWPLLTDLIGVSLVVRILQQVGGQPRRRAVPYRSGLPPPRIRRVIDYVESHIDRPITLVELSQIAALSPYHFARAFKKSVGVSPVRYVWLRRVERAKALLKDPHVTVTVAGFSCGFSSQSHFTTVFRRETGVTPSEYRRQVL